MAPGVVVGLLLVTAVVNSAPEMGSAAPLHPVGRALGDEAGLQIDLMGKSVTGPLLHHREVMTRVGGEREAVKSRRIAIDRCQGTEIKNPALAVVVSEGGSMMGSAGPDRLLSVAVGVTADRLSGLGVRKIAMVSERRQKSTTLKGSCACKRC
jgi:hypothetical protein